jgi:hypothetical protein
MYRVFEKLLNMSEKKNSIPESILEKVVESEWIKFSKEKPPHEVVLAACETYDCGWTMDTAWWYEDKQYWMTTGNVESTEAHLEYTLAKITKISE